MEQLFSVICTYEYDVQFLDCELFISRDPNECGAVLWTARRPKTMARLKEVTAEALWENTTFNLYEHNSISLFSKVGQLRFFVIKQRSHPVKMFVHGFSDFPWTGWIVAIKDNYLELGDYNVFSINWNRLAHAPWYNIAATNSRLEIKYHFVGNALKKA